MILKCGFLYAPLITRIETYLIFGIDGQVRMFGSAGSLRDCGKYLACTIVDDTRR